MWIRPLHFLLVIAGATTTNTLNLDSLKIALESIQPIPPAPAAVIQPQPDHHIALSTPISHRELGKVKYDPRTINSIQTGFTPFSENRVTRGTEQEKLPFSENRVKPRQIRTKKDDFNLLSHRENPRQSRTAADYFSLLSHREIPRQNRTMEDDFNLLSQRENHRQTRTKADDLNLLYHRETPRQTRTTADDFSLLSLPHDTLSIFEYFLNKPTDAEETLKIFSIRKDPPVHPTKSTHSYALYFLKQKYGKLVVTLLAIQGRGINYDDLVNRVYSNLEIGFGITRQHVLRSSPVVEQKIVESFTPSVRDLLYRIESSFSGRRSRYVGQKNAREAMGIKRDVVLTEEVIEKSLPSSLTVI
jgi:hypothetical protein